MAENYRVNTDLKYREKAYLYMLGRKRAAAWGTQAFHINKIKTNDRVFLYHNKVGYIAFGYAIGQLNVKPAHLDKMQHQKEHYIPLKLELKADPYYEKDKCLSIREIKRAMKQNLNFMGTCRRLSPKMADTIEKLLRKKRR